MDAVLQRWRPAAHLRGMVLLGQPWHSWHTAHHLPQAAQRRRLRRVMVLMMLECIMQGAPIAFNVSDAALATRMRHALALWLCGNPG